MTTVTINTGQTFQNMLWIGAENSYAPSVLTTPQSVLAYDPVNGVGLGASRFGSILWPTPAEVSAQWPSSPPAWTSAGAPIQGGNLGVYDTDAQAAIDIANAVQAQALGAFVWCPVFVAPTAWFDGSQTYDVFGRPNGYLLTPAAQSIGSPAYGDASVYTKMAGWMAWFPAFMQSQHGLTIQALGFNEIAGGGTLKWTAAEWAQFVVTYLAPAMMATCPTVQIIGPDDTYNPVGSSNALPSYASALVSALASAPSNVQTWLAAHWYGFSLHNYSVTTGGNPTQLPLYESYATYSPPLGTNVINSEWAVWNFEGSFDGSISDACASAGEISGGTHGVAWYLWNEIVTAQRNAVDALLLWPSQNLVYDDGDGYDDTKIFSDNFGLWQGSTGTPAKRFYAIGNFAKWAKGATVVGSSVAPAGVYVCPFLLPNGALAIVCLNENTSSVQVTLSGLGNATVVTPWVTDASNNLAAQATAAVSGGSVTVTLSPTSATTFVTLAAPAINSPLNGAGFSSSPQTIPILTSGAPAGVGAVIEVFANGTIIGSVAADGSGDATFNLNWPLVSESYQAVDMPGGTANVSDRLADGATAQDVATGAPVFAETPVQGGAAKDTGADHLGYIDATSQTVGAQDVATGPQLAAEQPGQAAQAVDVAAAAQMAPEAVRDQTQAADRAFDSSGLPAPTIASPSTGYNEVGLAFVPIVVTGAPVGVGAVIDYYVNGQIAGTVSVDGTGSATWNLPAPYGAPDQAAAFDVEADTFSTGHQVLSDAVTDAAAAKDASADAQKFPEAAKGGQAAQDVATGPQVAAEALREGAATGDVTTDVPLGPQRYTETPLGAQVAGDVEADRTTTAEAATEATLRGERSTDAVTVHGSESVKGAAESGDASTDTSGPPPPPPPVNATETVTEGVQARDAATGPMVAREAPVAGQALGDVAGSVVPVYRASLSNASLVGTLVTASLAPTIQNASLCGLLTEPEASNGIAA